MSTGEEVADEEVVSKDAQSGSVETKRMSSVTSRDVLITDAEAGETSGDDHAQETREEASLDEDPQVSLRDFFHRVYQVTYSKTVGLIIILALVIFVLIGVMITQASAGTYAEEASKDQFLAQMRAKYGGWAEVLNVLGFFHVFTSIGFFVVIVALAISITGCTIHRFPQLWRRFHSPRVTVTDRFFTAARYQASLSVQAKPGKAIGLAADKLKSQHYRVITGDGNSLYADKFSWGGFGTVVSHLSFIIILAAFFITGVLGYETVANLPIGGSAVAIGQGTNLEVRATDFNASFDEDGRPLDYVSHLVLTDGGEIVAEQDVRVNEPLLYGKWMFHQNSYGLAVGVSVAGTNGSTYYAGAVPLLFTADNGALTLGVLRVEELGLTIEVYSAASGASGNSFNIAAGQVVFVIYRDGQTQATDMDVVDQGTSVTIGDLSLAFHRESRYTGIQVRTDPGEIWMWIGAILLVAGMTVTFTCRHRRLWMKAQDGVLLFASADKEDSGFRANFDELVSQAETWFSVRRK